MQPDMILKGALTITGVKGSANNVARLWAGFEENAAAFPRVDDYYEVWLGTEVLVGSPAVPERETAEFVSISLPPTEYISFTALISKGLDGEKENIAKWLKDNAILFGQRQIEGREYVVKHFNKEAPTRVEIWVPVFRYCQAGYMPMLSEADYGSEADGSKNMDYCRYCYENGKFIADISMEEMIEFCVPFIAKHTPYPSEEEARRACREIFPRLKRWAK